MIGTDRIAAAADSLSERTAVRNFLLRSDVASQLRSMGVDQSDALARVTAMTDSEVRALAGNIESLPAGAGGANGWNGALLIILAGVLLYFMINSFWK